MDASFTENVSCARAASALARAFSAAELAEERLDERVVTCECIDLSCMFTLPELSLFSALCTLSASSVLFLRSDLL